MEMITAIIIAKNEEPMIEDCLKSLDFADEILLIDTGSIDKTISISKKYNSRIVEYLDGKNFSNWRNKGLKEAKGEWIFYIDADERVSPELRKEILNLVSKTSEVACFAIPRRNFILGKELKYGGWYPDYQKRLFQKSKLKRWRGDLHEEPDFVGSLEHLENNLIHQKHETFFEMVEKTNKWSVVEAKLMYDAKHPPMNVFRFITAMSREFWHRMIMKRAFLDGKVGIMFTLYQVFSRFVSYAKLWEMQINKKS